MSDWIDIDDFVRSLPLWTRFRIWLARQRLRRRLRS